MFDPDFDPLEMLYKTHDLLQSQQTTVMSLIDAYNRLNKLNFEMARTNALLTNKIIILEDRINAIEQTAANDRKRRE